jgi:hypothetical protein
VSTQTGNVTFGGFANIASTLQVAGLSTLTGNVTFSGFANIASTLQVGGTSAFNANVSVTGVTLLNGNVAITLLGNVGFPTVAKTANYTLTLNDDTILCNGTFTVTLLPAATANNHRFHIKNTNTGVITVQANGTEKIEGTNTYPMTAQYQTVAVHSDGTQWWVI